MILNYYGLSCFRLQSTNHDVTALIDPFEPSAGWKMPRVSSDLVLFSQDEGSSVAPKSKDGSPSFVINSPGEYEVKNIFVYGINALKKNKKGVEDHSTLFVLAIDDVFVGHLGGLDRILTEHELDQLGRIDILLVPVGGGSVLDARTALDVIGQIEPRIIVPMMYALPGLKGDVKPVDDFLKEYGTKDVQREEKLKVMKKDLPVDDQRVIVLNAA